jgi:hypothetical protein
MCFNRRSCGPRGQLRTELLLRRRESGPGSSRGNIPRLVEEERGRGVKTKFRGKRLIALRFEVGGQWNGGIELSSRWYQKQANKASLSCRRRLYVSETRQELKMKQALGCKKHKRRQNYDFGCVRACAGVVCLMLRRYGSVGTKG